MKLTPALGSNPLPSAQGYDEAVVNKVVRMVYRNDFKRFQIAPVLAISPKPFAMREMPIVKK